MRPLVTWKRAELPMTRRGVSLIGVIRTKFAPMIGAIQHQICQWMAYVLITCDHTQDRQIPIANDAYESVHVLDGCLHQRLSGLHTNLPDKVPAIWDAYARSWTNAVDVGYRCSIESFSWWTYAWTGVCFRLPFRIETFSDFSSKNVFSKVYWTWERFLSEVSYLYNISMYDNEAWGRRVNIGTWLS